MIRPEEVRAVLAGTTSESRPESCVWSSPGNRNDLQDDPAHAD